MTKRLIVILFIVISTVLPAQNRYKYWIAFTDKNNTPYSIDNPSEYLSERALQRRLKYGIAIDSLDLPVCPNYIQAVNDAGMTVRNPSRWMNGVTADADDSSAAAALRELPFVAEVTLYNIDNADGSPSYNWGYYSQRQSWDEEFSARWYGQGYNQIAQLNGIELHRAGYMGQGILIGVVDGGFPGVDTIRAFKRMRDEGRLVATRNFLNPSQPNVYRLNQHGTNVLSTLAAYEPGFMVGTAPLASYVLCITEDTYNESVMEEFNWISAIEFLDSIGADVVNTSLGYFTFDNRKFNYTLDQLDGKTAISTKASIVAVNKGMLLVNAIGNEGEFHNHIGVPADGKKVLSVGAVDADGSYASFSSRGPTTDRRIKPDVCALGVASTVIATNGRITSMNGTSFASPITCGMMACLLQRFPYMHPEQLCDSVRSWGNNHDNPNNYIGYGIPDYSRALLTDPAATEYASFSGINFKLCPNPSDGAVTLATKEIPSTATVQVYNLEGKMICGGSVGTELDRRLSVLPQGIYLIRIITNETNITLKMLRN